MAYTQRFTLTLDVKAPSKLDADTLADTVAAVVAFSTAREAIAAGLAAVGVRVDGFSVDEAPPACDFPHENGSTNLK